MARQQKLMRAGVSLPDVRRLRKDDRDRTAATRALRKKHASADVVKMCLETTQDKIGDPCDETDSM